MDDEDSLIATEVGKFVSVPSSSESADGIEDSQRKKKKKKKKKKNDSSKEAAQPGAEVAGPLDVSVEPGSGRDSAGIRTVDIPADAIKGLAADAHMDAGWVRISKTALENLLASMGESDPNLPALRAELAALTWEEVAVRVEGGRVQVVVNESALSEADAESHRRRMLLEAVEKHPRPWSSLGSEQEVQQGLVSNTRPLISLEMETRIEDLRRPLSLRQRLADSAHGYVALGPSGRVSPGVRRVRMDAAVQAVPRVQSTAAQMEPGLPVNAWTQYVYDLEGAVDVGQTGSELPPSFKFEQLEYLERALEYNETFNLYTNDYPLLVVRENDAVVPPTAAYATMDSLTEVRHTADQVVVSIAWHPMCSGEVAVVYGPTTRGLLHDRTGPPPAPDVFRRNTILLWSLRDPLKPRSVLSSPREVLTVRWCPVNADILVGACASGQVVIWDLAGLWSQNEEKEEPTRRQQRARKALQGILQWTQPDGPSPSSGKIAPVALSALAFSHQGAATDLQWLTPYHRLNSDGHYEPMKSYVFALQFLTCGEDGALLIWDLNVVPEEAVRMEKLLKFGGQPAKKTTERVSRFQSYHRFMKPIYKFFPQIAQLKTKIIITSIAVDNFVVEYTDSTKGRSSLTVPRKSSQKIEAEENDEVIDWKVLRPVFRATGAKPLPAPERAVWVGTEDGIVTLVHWQGFTFDKGEEVTTECVEATGACAAVHDGPIVCVQRAPLLPELVLTVGGHVFALWKAERPNVPVLSRRSPVHLTSAAWSPVRPSLFRIARVDGTLEVWDFLYRSDRPVLEQSLSGEPLTATAAYPLPLRNGRLILAVADYRNALHLYYMPTQFQNRGPDDISAMRVLMEREIELLNRYESWNQKYCAENKEIILKRKTVVVEENKQTANPAAELTAKLEAAEEKRFAKARAKSSPLVSKKEEDKMLAILLRKKNLDKAELMAKQQPLRLLQQMAEEKKEKNKLKIKHQQEDFEKTIATLLPECTDEPVETGFAEQALREEVRQDVGRMMAEWQVLLEGGGDREEEDCAMGRTLQRRKVLEEGAARRSAVDGALPLRHERYMARQAQWRLQPPPPPALAHSPPSKTSLALQREEGSGRGVDISKVSLSSSK